MNTCFTFLVRVGFLVLAAMWAAPCAAQGKDGSLTTDFKKLSPKERSKIAAQETEAAAMDSGYQDIMQQADVAFRAGRYEDALAAFQHARTLRPYNVYPKVKIQDLQALIKQRDQERAAQKPEPPPAATPEQTEAPKPAATAPPVTPPPVETGPAPPEATPVEQDTPAPLPVEKKQVPAPGSTPLPHATPSDRTRPTPAGDPKPASIGERVYMEAGATVTERTVADEGRPVVYKKVVHSWGPTFYFKDGLAISEREWKDRFTE